MRSCCCGGCLSLVTCGEVVWNECQSCGAQWDERTLPKRGHLVLTRRHLDMFQLLGETECGLFQVRIDDIFEKVVIWRRRGKVWRIVCVLESSETFDLSFDDEVVTFGFNEYRCEGSVQIGIRAISEIKISRV